MRAMRQHYVVIPNTRIVFKEGHSEEFFGSHIFIQLTIFFIVFQDGIVMYLQLACCFHRIGLNMSR